MLRRLLLLFALCVTAGLDPLRAGDLDDWTRHLDGRLLLGGEVRLRAEGRQDFDFDESRRSLNLDDRFGLSRIRLNLDLRPHELFRAYLQVQDARVAKIADPSAVKGLLEDRVDIYQLYGDLDLTSKIPLRIRAGRQTLAYGNERLVGAFDWSNTARSFQGVRLFLTPGPVDIDAWWVNVVRHVDGDLDEPVWADDFIGVHARWNHTPGGSAATYFLLRDNSTTGRRLYTLGGRFVGTPVGDGTIDYDVEAAIQTGEFSTSLDQAAFLFHAGAGRTFPGIPGRPRIGFQYNFATGDDDSTDADHATPDNLYPTNHLHYGSIDLLSWRNMRNLKIESSIRPLGLFLLKGDFHLFWLEEVADAWFNAGGGEIRRLAAGGASGASVGREIDITTKFSPIPHFSIMAGVTLFLTGDFVEATGPSDNPTWFFLQTTLSI